MSSPPRCYLTRTAMHGMQVVDDGSDRAKPGAGRGRGRGGKSGDMTAKNRRKARANKKDAAEAKKEVNVREEIFEIPTTGMTVGELAKLLAVGSAEVVKALFMKGIMAPVRHCVLVS